MTRSWSIQSVLGGGLDHGVLAADLVGAERDVEAHAGFGDDVEVGDGGLDHDHVGALLKVELDFAHGFAGVGRVHLVAAAVAEGWSGVGGLAEGSVEAAGELGGVAHDGRVLEAVGVERSAQGLDAAIHHVRGGDDVNAGLGLGDGGFGQKVERGIVDDLVLGLGSGAVHLFDDAAVAVRHVLAQADVSHDDQVGDGGLDGAGGPLHDAVFGPGSGGDLVFRLRQAEENDGGDAEGMDLAAFLDRLIDGEVEDAGHGADRLADAFAGTDEERIDEAGGSKPGLAHERAQGFGAAQPALTIDRKGHDCESIVPQRDGREVMRVTVRELAQAGRRHGFMAQFCGMGDMTTGIRSELVLLAQFLMEQEFLFARGRLESAGIECFCSNETSAGSAAASTTE